MAHPNMLHQDGIRESSLDYLSGFGDTPLVG